MYLLVTGYKKNARFEKDISNGDEGRVSSGGVCEAGERMAGGGEATQGKVEVKEGAKEEAANQLEMLRNQVS